MSSAQSLVDSRTAQRLRLRRVLVVDSTRDRAEAFAYRLQSAGATAVAVSADHGPHAAVHALDADVMMVNEDEPEAVRALVIALRRHPRTRWATVLPCSFTALWPRGAEHPDIAAMAEELSRLAESLMELSVRARGKLPYETALEPLGPNRILRVLDNTNRHLRVVLSSEQLSAELELGDHRVSRVRAAFAEDARPLVDVEALAAVLAMSSGHVRIEEGGAKGPVSWNAALSAGLEVAATLACARMMPDEDPAPAASGVRPAVSEQSATLERVLDAQARPHEGTVPQINVAEVLGDAEDLGARIHSDAPDEPGPARSERPSSRPTVQVNAAPSEPPPERVAAVLAAAAAARAERAAAGVAPEVLAEHAAFVAAARRRRKARAATGVVVLALAGAAAFLLWRAGSLPWQRTAAARAVQSTAIAPAAKEPGKSHAQARARAADANDPTAVPAAAVAPAVPAAEASAPGDPQAPREPTAREIKEARSITARGHRYLRAERPETAAKAYLNALELVPDHAPAIAPLVRIYLDYANAPDAIHWAERLVELQPNDGNAYLLLGDAQELSGDGTAAEQAWQRARALGNKLASKRLEQR